MTKQEVRARIEEIGIIPAIRLSSAEDALFAAKAVADSGIPIAEVTMTIPGAIEVISQLVRDRPGLIVGAGTITDTETALRCLGAGAMFLTSPGLDLQIVNFAVKPQCGGISGRLDAQRNHGRLEGRLGFRQGFSLFTAGRSQLHQRTEVAIPAHTLDRFRRRNSG